MANTATLPTTTPKGEDASTVNDVVASSIAANVASATNLSVAPNVSELAVTTELESKLVQTDGNSSITKPQILELSSASRTVTTYKVKRGDTLGTIASQFDISKDTIRWANDLTSDSLIVGTDLDILPVTGIGYVVKDGDTVGKLATKYKANAATVTSYNDLEISGLKKGLKIIIPDGILPVDERPGYASPQTATYITGYSAGFSSGRTWYIRAGTPNNGAYAPGNCTAYAFDRRAELGRPVGRNWGNAGAWATNAINAGFAVNRNPSAGSVIQDYGHVAIVEKVLPNGDLELSEMNASVSGGGWNIVSGRILPKASVSQYLYIH